MQPAPGIVLLKSLSSVVDTTGDGLIGAGDTARYGFAVTNTGNVALAGVTVSDPLVSVSGGPVSLAIGQTDSTSFTAAYVLTQADVDRGYVQNTATTTGRAVTSSGSDILDGSGNPVTTSDTSDTGTAPDGTPVAAPATTESPDGTGATDADPTNDPTVALLEPAPQITLIKRLTGSVDVNGNGYLDQGDTLNYAFEVTNTGNVVLGDVRVTDPLVTVAGGPISLAIGATDSTSFTASYTVTAADVVRSYVENTAEVTGMAVTAAGDPILDGSGNPVTVTDTSDTGTNPDGSPVTDPGSTETPDGTGVTDDDPANDPTVTIVGRPEIHLDIAIADITDTNGNGIIDAGDVIIYTFTVTNTGEVALSDANMDPASLSLPMPGLTCTPISLAVGETQTLVCTGNTYTITLADVAAETVTLTGTATGVSPVGLVVSDDDAVVSPVMGLGGLTITKVVDRGLVSPGEVVTYTITVTNTSATLTSVTDVVDVLPQGFVYQIGTATVAGVATEPVTGGRTLTWEGVSLAPGGSAAVVLEVLVAGSAGPGDHDNVARGVSPLTGQPVTPDAVATVRVAVEPVFDCSTVIGRVFDDLNQDGYYNGEPKEDRAALTDQTYGAGKWGALEEPQREKGLPAVRLIAPNGLAITTDVHGRFSVPCAALPADIGSNFMLKLDTRTLPSGYRLTTENPRVVRVTPGMITKMNFGATISRIVRVDLSGKAFGTGDDAKKPRPELIAALEQMVAKIADTPAMLRLSYQLVAGESEALARQRMKAVERVLRKLWPANGRYQLNVETVIQRRSSKTVNE
ncbi:conserved repeat domain protein [Rhodobacter ferrooxidans]|uniref:Conserved repeat domain protein n=1 Tax=Rhodobacter ferrooxidans TaxID=371731 RepID=C8RZD1_9RHOB|nr:conserved repeat domain protein [Rhodobacter sp. SW2]